MRAVGTRLGEKAAAHAADRIRGHRPIANEGGEALPAERLRIRVRWRRENRPDDDVIDLEPRRLVELALVMARSPDQARVGPALDSQHGFRGEVDAARLGKGAALPPDRRLET